MLWQRAGMSRVWGTVGASTRMIGRTAPLEHFQRALVWATRVWDAVTAVGGGGALVLVCVGCEGAVVGCIQRGGRGHVRAERMSYCGRCVRRRRGQKEWGLVRTSLGRRGVCWRNIWVCGE